MVFIWIVAALLLLAAEIHTLAFYSVFLAVGAFAAAVTTAFTDQAWIQGLVFLGVSAVTILLLRPLLWRRFGSRSHSTSLPGVQGFVGQSGLTIDPIGDQHHPGHIQLAGERWLAITDGDEIAAGVSVTVDEVRGTTLVVH